MEQYGNTAIIRNNFSNNFASYGGAILLLNSQSNALFEIADCAFIENNSTNYGGAVYMETYGNTSIIRSHFSNNFGSFGGAILLLSSQSNTIFEITDCAFVENNSTTNGGAIDMDTYGNTSIIRSNFSNNFASSYGGAIYFLKQSIFFNSIFFEYIFFPRKALIFFFHNFYTLQNLFFLISPFPSIDIYPQNLHFFFFILVFPILNFVIKLKF